MRTFMDLAQLGLLSYIIIQLNLLREGAQAIHESEQAHMRHIRGVLLAISQRVDRWEAVEGKENEKSDL